MSRKTEYIAMIRDEIFYRSNSLQCLKKIIKNDEHIFGKEPLLKIYRLTELNESEPPRER